jgi:nucleoside-diphosphate-sugar epimerase
MKILVLGASGQIGRPIYNELKLHFETIGTTREISDSLKQFDPFLDDWSSFGRIDVLVNCVGQITSTSGNSFYKIHVGLAHIILRNRQTLGNPRIIQISALGSSTTHRVTFLQTKAVADALIGQYENTVIVRPSIVCTHQTTLVKKMLMLSKLSRLMAGWILLPKGFLKTRIQPVMIEDLVGLVAKLCDMAVVPRIVNLTGPEEFTFKQILQLAFLAQRRNFKTIELPKWVMDKIVLYFIAIAFPHLVNGQQYKLLFEHNVADHNEAIKILGRPLKPVLQFFHEEFHDAKN